MILVNFKIYKQSWGEGAVRLVEICRKVSKESGVKIIPVVSALEAGKVEGEKYIQNVDEYTEGRWTGWISGIQAVESGVSGTLINHSEHKVPPGKIRKIMKQLPDGFESVLCVRSLGQAEKWAIKLKPSYLAYEPEELIGSRDKSVATEEPKAIASLVKMAGEIPVLVGAGIHNKNDVQIALKLGARGVLVSSNVVTATDPEKELRELAEGFK